MVQAGFPGPPSLRPSSFHGEVSSGNPKPRPGPQPASAQELRLHTEQEGAHWNLTAANTSQTLDAAPGPVLSACRHYVVESLHQGCGSLVSSILPILSPRQARAPRPASAQHTRAHFWAMRTSFLEHFNQFTHSFKTLLVIASYVPGTVLGVRYKREKTIERISAFMKLII